MGEWVRNAIINERVRRQGLLDPLVHPGDEAAYLELFHRLQPMAPVHNTRPGDPPRLVHRTAYSDFEVSGSLRERGALIKGRFQNGRIAYVLEEDLQLYATAFRKDLTRFGAIHSDILRLVREAGGMSKDQLKEELPYKAGDIGKALEELQRAFVLYEQQTDRDWDTGWLDFAEEWFSIPTDEESRKAAMEKVILRFVHAMVFATEGWIKSWSGWTGKLIGQMVAGLVEQGKLVRGEVTGWGAGVMCREDAESAWVSARSEELPVTVWMLDKSDFLVRAEMDELKKRYEGYEVLQYLLIDGLFQGVVLGHWGFRDYDIEDIVLNLPEEAIFARRDEVLSAVRKVYDPEVHRIVKYHGIAMN